MKQHVLMFHPDVALEFIAEFEQGPKGGPALQAYLCPAGVWTIGFGHTKDVHPGEHITRNEAYDLLTKDLVQTQEELAAIVKAPVTENQFIALMSWLFNLGLTPAVRRSTLLRKLNAGDYEGAAEEFPKWRKSAGQVLPGLVNRRAEEKKIFLKE